MLGSWVRTPLRPLKILKKYGTAHSYIGNTLDFGPGKRGSTPRWATKFNSNIFGNINIYHYICIKKNIRKHTAILLTILLWTEEKTFPVNNINCGVEQLVSSRGS